jgi:hypothetical protein
MQHLVFVLLTVATWAAFKEGLRHLKTLGIPRKYYVCSVVWLAILVMALNLSIRQILLGYIFIKG